MSMESDKKLVKQALDYLASNQRAERVQHICKKAVEGDHQKAAHKLELELDEIAGAVSKLRGDWEDFVLAINKSSIPTKTPHGMAGAVALLYISVVANEAMRQQSGHKALLKRLEKRFNDDG